MILQRTMTSGGITAPGASPSSIAPANCRAGRLRLDPRIFATANALMLLGVFFTKFTIVPVISLAFCIALIGVGFLMAQRIDRLAPWVLINYALWLGSAILVGAVGAADLLDIEFYDGEGRIFLFYLPLLLYSAYMVDRSVAQRLVGLAKLMALLGVLLIPLSWFMPSLRGGILLHGFTSSHHVPGVLFSILALLLVSVAYYRRDRMAALAAVGCLAVVVASGSRMSMLALCLVAGWAVVRTHDLRLALRAFGVLAMVGVLSISIVPAFKVRVVDQLSTDVFDRVVTQYRVTPSTASSASGVSIVGKEHNLLVRAALWKMAVGRIQHSPLVGIGFGRWNVIITECTGQEGLVHIATQGEKRFNTAQVHNGYLQVLVDNGILGLALLMILWINLYQRLNAALARWHEDTLMRAGLLSSQAIVLFVAGCALPGHGFATPSIGVPALTVIGVFLSWERHRRSAEGASQPSEPSP